MYVKLVRVTDLKDDDIDNEIACTTMGFNKHDGAYSYMSSDGRFGSIYYHEHRKCNISTVTKQTMLSYFSRINDKTHHEHHLYVSSCLKIRLCMLN